MRRREQGRKRLPRSSPAVCPPTWWSSREGLNELIAAKKIAAGTDVDLARVPLGVAVRVGTPKPDVSTVEAFKQVLLRAKTVAIPGSTSGIWLTTDLFPRLGIAEKINVKVTPRGTDATGMVAAGGADLAVMPVSEIVHARDIDLAGSIAPEIQFVQRFQPASWPARETLKVLND